MDDATGIEQVALICLMVFNMLPILAVPSAWKDNRGWRRFGALMACLAMYLFMTALTVGYVLLLEFA